MEKMFRNEDSEMQAERERAERERWGVLDGLVDELVSGDVVIRHPAHYRGHTRRSVAAAVILRGIAARAAVDGRGNGHLRWLCRWAWRWEQLGVNHWGHPELLAVRDLTMRWMPGWLLRLTVAMHLWRCLGW